MTMTVATRRAKTTRGFVQVFAVLVIVILGRSGVAREPELSAAEREVFRVVESSQRAGHERHDLHGYTVALTEDAVFVRGRAERPAVDDHTFTRAQIVSRASRTMRGPSPGIKIRFTDVTVQIEGVSAKIRLKQHFGVAGAAENIVGETYRLRKSADGWRVFENRTWPIRFGETVFTAAQWGRLDAEVLRARRDDDSVAYVEALRAALRFVEAHDAAKSLTRDYADIANAWLYRGYAALDAAEGRDAELCFLKARALDPDAEVPAWVTAQPNRPTPNKPEPNKPEPNRPNPNKPDSRPARSAPAEPLPESRPSRPESERPESERRASGRTSAADDRA